MGDQGHQFLHHHPFLVIHDIQRLKGIHKTPPVTDVHKRTSYSQYFPLSNARIFQIDHHGDSLSSHLFDPSPSYIHKGWARLPDHHPKNKHYQNKLSCIDLSSPVPSSIYVYCLQEHGDPIMFLVKLANIGSSIIHSPSTGSKILGNPPQCNNTIHLLHHDVSKSVILSCNDVEGNKRFWKMANDGAAMMQVDSWTPMTRVPSFPGAKRHNDTMHIIHDTLYLIGGQYMEKYHVVDNWKLEGIGSESPKWTQLARLPTYNSIFGSAVFKDKWIVLCGGIEMPSDLLGYPESDVTKYGDHEGYECEETPYNTRYSNQCVAYNIELDGFHHMYPLRINWVNPTISIYQGSVYFTGGFVAKGSVDSVLYHGYSHILLRGTILEAKRLD